MKLKYYLRGLGIGIIITTIILTISYSGRKSELTDEEIIQRAEELGMVMEEDSLFPFENKEKESETESIAGTEQTETENIAETEQQNETEDIAGMQKQPETEDMKETQQPETVAGTEEVKTYRLTILPGEVAQNISNILEENGVIEDGYSFRKYLAEVGYTTLLKVGEYEIPYGASHEEIYQILKEGPL